MAIQRQPIINLIKPHRLPLWGLLLSLGILLLYGGTMMTLLFFQPLNQIHLNTPYLIHLLQFSVKQALYSTILSVGLGFIFAQALFYFPFKGRNILISLLSISFVMPTLVVVFTVVGLYGHASWIADIANYLGYQWNYSIYGLSGILIAHVLLNFPMATQLLYQTLSHIPSTQRKVANQLGIQGLRLFLYVEWPALKQQITAISLLIFTLCFSSFAIVLTLGGGPKSSTLEVAIFQAIQSFNLGEAAIYALFQWFFCFILFLLGHRYTSNTHTRIQDIHNPWFAQPSALYRLFLKMSFLGLFLFWVLPFLHILTQSLFPQQWIDTFSKGAIYQAILDSTWIGIGSGITCILISYLLLKSIMSIQQLGFKPLGSWILSLGMASLAMPTLVLSVGLYIILNGYLESYWQVMTLLFLCNAIKTMPFILRVLYEPMKAHETRYQRLINNLGLSTYMRTYILDWRALKHLFSYAFVLCFALSIGDFTVIAFFGHYDVTPLPLLLYQQMGHYQIDTAGVTACVLLMYCLSIFLILQRISPEKK
ncbi:MAG: thiamine/thiamine pyrophosphate ABC transporter permease [Alcaligenaceae bacterium]|nr:thiamine/thiamine pyrophosphate ABC transporter permease [Alcaligenaceae bacterium]